MAKVILHVGPHKTASTFIQRELLSNQKALAAQGVVYPSDGINVQYGQHEVPGQLAAGQPSETLARIVAGLGRDQTLLLSSENFDRLTEPQLGLLAQQLEGCRIEVLYVHRRPDRRLLSLWQEECKHGGTLTWSEHFLQHASRPYLSGVLNPNRVLNRYRRVLGAKVALIDYENAAGSPDLAQAVLNFVAPSGRFVVQEEAVNSSSSPIGSEVLRALNALYAVTRKAPAGVRVRRGMNESFRQTCKDEMKELRATVQAHARPVEIMGVQMIHSIQKRLLASYAASVRGELSTAEGPTTVELPSSDWVFAPGALALLNHVLRVAVPDNEA